MRLMTSSSTYDEAPGGCRVPRPSQRAGGQWRRHRPRGEEQRGPGPEARTEPARREEDRGPGPEARTERARREEDRGPGPEARAELARREEDRGPLFAGGVGQQALVDLAERDR